MKMEAEVKWFIMSQGIPVVSRKPQKAGERLQWTPSLTASQDRRAFLAPEAHTSSLHNCQKASSSCLATRSVVLCAASLEN